ncbi:MAG TPA: MraY family glycosyltransferase [Acidimicrobiia bacterium]
MPDNTLAVALALITSLALVWGLRPVARWVGLVDRPDGELKDHSREIPIVGGISVFLGLHIAMEVGGIFDVWLFGITLAMLVVGVVDDIVGISPLLRLLAEGGAGVVMGLGVGSRSDVMSLVVIVAFVVVAINAVNLLDGADGLAGSAAFVSAIGLAFLARTFGTGVWGPLVLAGAIAGFLVFNWPPAQVFLGDGGAYVVGVALAFFAVSLGGEPAIAGSDWLPITVIAGSTLGVFLVDLVVTLLRRVVSRAPLFGGDRSHVYDQLALAGHTPKRVVAMVAGAQVSIVTLVVAFAHWFEPWVAAVSGVSLIVVSIIALSLLGFATGRAGHEAREAPELTVGE